MSGSYKWRRAAAAAGAYSASLPSLLYTAEKLLRRDTQLASMLEFVRHAHSTKLANYSGTSVDHILRLLYHDDDDDDNDDDVARSMDNRSTVSRPASVSMNTDHHHSAQLDHDDDQTSTHDVAHGLHFASIAMLGVLVLEVAVRTIQYDRR